MKRALLFLFLTILLGEFRLCGQSIEEGFKNPPVSTKPKGNWCLVNGNFDLTQMTGDSKRIGREKRTHSNITRGPNAWSIPFNDLSPVASGLLGPVKIKFSEQINIAEND